jgi:acetyl-CoA carboxylase carboxyl transferase subunit beta
MAGMSVVVSAAMMSRMRSRRPPLIQSVSAPMRAAVTSFVAASFASLGDLCFAEPRALIGFAGPRTIKATIRVELPKGFQTSEFLLEHGAIDLIADRRELRPQLGRLLSILTHAAATGRAEPVAAQTPA